MTRLLILIFALNALVTPASATGVCEMMDDSNLPISSSAMLGQMDEMSDMDCCGDSAKTCASDCATSATPLLLTESQKKITVAGRHSPIQSGLAYFYKIILSVDTPPPLV